MRFFLGWILLGVLSSCSTASKQEKFSIAANCSPRALERLKKFRSPLKNKGLSFIKSITAPIAKEAADKCYYDVKTAYSSGYNVCTLISTDMSGKVIFIDVEDNANKLPGQLQKCLVDAFMKGKYKMIPAQTFGQPLSLSPGKRTY